MEYVFYGLLAVAFIAFVVLVIRSYRKKLASGCCGASDESVKKNKVADKDKSHYPYEKTLVVDGMVCKNCSARVENALNSIDGVWAEADVSSGRVTVRMKREIEDKVIKKAVNDIGAYTVMKVPLVRSYIDVTEVTPEILNSFIDKIYIGKPERIGGQRVQEVKIIYELVGAVNIPQQQ